MNFFIVDAFTDAAFKGNPAAVYLIDKFPSEEKMLNIAFEMGYSETAFVVHRNENNYDIRYFSPAEEIPLCGHATMASSKVLFRLNEALTKIEFTTIRGEQLLIQKTGDQIQMEFPIYNLNEIECKEEIVKALNINESQVLSSSYNEETNITMLEIDQFKTVFEMEPDFNELLIALENLAGVLVTAKGDEKTTFDFCSRFFWPASGIDEDPVTGGTHTFMSKFWADKLSKNVLNSFQASKRTGFMEVEILKSNRLLMRSKAVILMEGNWKA